jgi:hypothetical protein
MQSPIRPGRELGDLVRNASKHKGPWPKLSVWHGSADRIVDPTNANEIVKQWLDVHRLPATPMSEATVDGYPRQIWWNADGETTVESYTITNMAHGTPLGIADNDERYGAQGAFLIEAGISSSYHIANFFGLTERVAQPKEIEKEVEKQIEKRVAKQTVRQVAKPQLPPASRETAKETAITIPAAASVPAPMPDLAAVLWPRTTLTRAPEPLRQPRRQAIDVGAVITRALTAAGLMK